MSTSVCAKGAFKFRVKHCLQQPSFMRYPKPLVCRQATVPGEWEICSDSRVAFQSLQKIPLESLNFRMVAHITEIVMTAERRSTARYLGGLHSGIPERTTRTTWAIWQLKQEQSSYYLSTTSGITHLVKRPRNQLSRETLSVTVAHVSSYHAGSTFPFGGKRHPIQCTSK